LESQTMQYQTGFVPYFHGIFLPISQYIHRRKTSSVKNPSTALILPQSIVRCSCLSPLRTACSISISRYLWTSPPFSPRQHAATPHGTHAPVEPDRTRPQ